MGVVRIDEKLHKRVQKFLDENGNRYKYPTMSAFINSAVYEKIERLKDLKRE